MAKTAPKPEEAIKNLPGPAPLTPEQEESLKEEMRKALKDAKK